ncbi:MAG: S-methyl-5'-thioadenosine phosphorylase [Thermoprotei archaeon]|nr:MAG: S-methyl-5'-thioadenosine phosphorylase [Thermoprotei archaeon]
MKIGIIAGSGMEELADGAPRQKVKTTYGEAEVAYVSLQGIEVVLLPRHGFSHTVPPHRVNYRANIASLKKLGVERVIATAAVGSLNDEFKPGDLVVVNDFLDFTKSRPPSFHEGLKVIHVDLTTPYCPEVRACLIEGCRKSGVEVHDGGVYVCTEGPRFETPAEIRMFRRLGGDVVGMTGLPEAVLAREAGLCYASLCIVTNMAAGMQARITASEVVEVMRRVRPTVVKVLAEALHLIPDKRGCGCSQASLTASSE